MNLLIETGKLEEATALAQRCYDTALAYYGVNHVEVARAATLFVDLYEKLEQPELEAKWRARISGTPYDVPEEENSAGSETD